MFQDRSCLQDFEALPPEKQAEVIDFIQFLRSRKGSFLEKAKDLPGIVDDAPSDLATHPKHRQGFGE